MTISTASTVHTHFTNSVSATERFFDSQAARVAECCRRMAYRFGVGGTLYVAGEGSQVSDAQHVAVEFVHPVIVGKRALPAVALTTDAGVLSAAARAGGAAQAFAWPLQALSGPGDMLLALIAGDPGPAIERALSVARDRGLLTVAVNGPTDPSTNVDLGFTIDSADPLVVQEVSETLYHVLWELVHVFLDHQAIDASAFLRSGGPTDEGALVEHVVASTREKANDVIALRKTVLSRYDREIGEAAAAVADRIRRNGRIFAIGNGGSATDAQDVAADCMAPAIAGWRSVPALALTNDVGVVTAIGNDVGFEHVFARQLAAFGGATDVALAFSTSGASPNLLAAMAQARSRGMLTVAMSGGDGGALAHSAGVNFCFIVPSEHLPRIQEAHATIWHALLAAAQETLR
jgi:D-sedoheptulose 7-phosphate isomerase